MQADIIERLSGLIQGTPLLCGKPRAARLGGIDFRPVCRQEARGLDSHKTDEAPADNSATE
jgi:hypothetical protein